MKGGQGGGEGGGEGGGGGRGGCLLRSSPSCDARYAPTSTDPTAQPCVDCSIVSSTRSALPRASSRR